MEQITLKNLIIKNIRQYAMFIALFVIMIVFNILTGGVFLKSRNLTNLYLQSGYIAVLAIGMVLVIVAGHIDLSVGSIAAFTGAIAAILQVNYKLSTVPTIILVLLLGVAIGIWQGFWIAYQGIPAFIVTLGGMLIFRGGVIAVTQGRTIGPFSESFRLLGSGYLPDFFMVENLHAFSLILGIFFLFLFIVADLNARKKKKLYGFQILPVKYYVLRIVVISILVLGFLLSMVLYKGFPYTAIVVVVLLLGYSYMTGNTTVGRYIYAIGGNKEAARLSGINIKRINMLVFISMGVLATISGMLYSARLNSATAAAGNLFELDAIAAAFVGGASTSGGIGTVFGAIIGALVMASINNGMSLMNLDISFQYVIKGLVLILAVWFDIYTRRAKK